MIVCRFKYRGYGHTIVGSKRKLLRIAKSCRRWERVMPCRAHRAVTFTASDPLRRHSVRWASMGRSSWTPGKARRPDELLDPEIRARRRAAPSPTPVRSPAAAARLGAGVPEMGLGRRRPYFRSRSSWEWRRRPYFARKPSSGWTQRPYFARRSGAGWASEAPGWGGHCRSLGRQRRNRNMPNGFLFSSRIDAATPGVTASCGVAPGGRRGLGRRPAVLRG